MRNLTLLTFILFNYYVTYAQPTNDECTGATVIIPNNCLTYTSGTTNLATRSSPNFTCSGSNNNDVWFSFEATGNTHSVTVAPNTLGTDLVHEVFASTTLCGGSDNQIECSDPNNSTLTGLTIGVTYFIRVYTFNGSTNESFDICVGELDICNSTGTNDYCSSATPISENGSSTNAVTYGMHSPDETQIKSSSGGPFCGSIENNSWYKFIADSTTENFNFTTVSGSDCSLGLQAMVFDVTGDANGCCNTFTGMSNCWEPGTATPGTVTATGLTTGNTYYLMIDGRFGDICNYTLDQWGETSLANSFERIGGNQSPDGNLIYWKTSQEANTKYFVIESSIDGKQYKKIGQIELNEDYTSENVYQFIDKKYKKRTYYRVKQFYKDKSYNYSKVILIKSSFIDLKIFPNPSNEGSFHITTDGDKLKDINFFITNVYGQQINFEYSSNLNQAIIYLGEVPSGTYLLFASTPNNKVKKILMKK